MPNLGSQPLLGLCYASSAFFTLTEYVQVNLGNVQSGTLEQQPSHVLVSAHSLTVRQSTMTWERNELRHIKSICLPLILYLLVVWILKYWRTLS